MMATLAALGIMSPSSAMAAGDSAYVACSVSPTAAPSTICQVGKHHALFFETRGGEVQYTACISSPNGRQSCTKEFTARPGYLSVVATSGSGAVGDYSVAWFVGGQQVTSWSYQLVSEAPLLTLSTVTTGFRAKLFAEIPEASFPRNEGKLCPRLYSNVEGSRSTCIAEFKVGDLWGLVGVVATNDEGIILSPLTSAQWTRRWVRCALASAGATLTSNNNCAYGQPETDAQLVSRQVAPNIRFHHPTHPVGWQFTESSGFNSIGIYHGSKRGRSYQFTNAVGDSFRYTP